MRLIWRDKRVALDLYKTEETILSKARELGEALTAMNQPTGKPLVDAVDAILEPPGENQDEDE